MNVIGIRDVRDGRIDLMIDRRLARQVMAVETPSAPEGASWNIVNIEPVVISMAVRTFVSP